MGSLVKAESAGATIAQNLVFAVWGRMAQSLWAAKDFAAWAGIFDLESDGHPLGASLRTTMDNDKISKFVEENIMNSLVVFLRESGQADAVREAVRPLREVITTRYSATPFGEDILNFAKIALVKECASSEVERLKQLRDSMSSADSQSRFMRPLRLFSTGRDLAAEVDVQLDTHLKERALVLDLEALHGWATDLGHPKPEKVFQGFRRFEDEQLASFKTKAEGVAVLEKRASERFLREHKEQLTGIKGCLATFFTDIEQAVKHDYQASLSKALERTVALIGQGKMALKVRVFWLSVSCPPCPQGPIHYSASSSSS